MDIKAIIRTSAIIYADETSSVSTTAIQQKFIEAVFIENTNQPLNINSLITAMEDKFNLTFSLNETIAIINNSEIDTFNVQHSVNLENTIISLSQKRYQLLKQKEIKNDFDNYIKEFSETCQDCNLSWDEMNGILLRYLFELLNTNIQLYTSILEPSNAHNCYTIDSSKFSDIEIRIINEFLSWDKPEKNEGLFKLISYCIEYSLVVNHSSNDNTYLASIRNKYFYLDNNLIYRAIGINSANRRERTTVFLKKCLNSGIKLFISKYSKKEFFDTVDYHIHQLKKLPFGHINPELFSKYCTSTSFYEYYHAWRNSRTTYGFDSFKAHVLGEYDKLLKEYSISEDDSIPYDENNPEVLKIIDNYKYDIQTIKGNGSDNSHQFDAQNSFFIEKKRGENNKRIQETKYYLITTDQKLKIWDDKHSKNQPVAMLPSQWMGLLLKYISRTDDDFKSFVSFLKLKHHDNLIDEHSLHVILSGISEITEDFKRQETVMERMVEIKFSDIIDSKNHIVSREGAKNFAKEVLEQELEKTKILHREELENTTAKHLLEQERLKNDSSIHIKELTSKFEKSKLEEKYEYVCKDLKKINKLRANADIVVNRKYSSERYKVFFLPSAFGLILITCVLIFPWNTMEAITYIAGALIVGLTYLYLAVHGHSFDPSKYFLSLEEEVKRHTYLEYDVNLDELSELEVEKVKLEEQINNFQEV